MVAIPMLSKPTNMSATSSELDTDTPTSYENLFAELAYVMVDVTVHHHTP